jgi:hypothetical protein
MEERGKLKTLLEYYITHNEDHGAELEELAGKFRESGIDPAGIISAAGLMKKSVEALRTVTASL